MTVITPRKQILSAKNLEGGCRALSQHITSRMKQRQKFAVCVDLSDFQGVDVSKRETLDAIKMIGDTLTDLSCTSTISGAYLYIGDALAAGLVTMAVNGIFKPPVPFCVSSSKPELSDLLSRSLR